MTEVLGAAGYCKCPVLCIHVGLLVIVILGIEASQ